MAHECFNCGSECYCNGHIDDFIVSKTPPNCNSCGCCQNDYNDDDDFMCCSECDLPDACNDFGCAIEQGIRGRFND